MLNTRRKRRRRKIRERRLRYTLIRVLVIAIMPIKNSVISEIYKNKKASLQNIS